MKSAYISYLTALLLFGTNGIVASYILLSSGEIVLYRTCIGSLFLLLLFLISKRKWTFYCYKKNFLFLVFSGASMGCSWMFLYEAYDLIGVSIASLLYYCGPVLVMALSPILFKEKFILKKIIGFLLVIIGIVFINGNLHAGNGNGFGLFCGLMSAVLYAAMVTCNKKAANISGLENSLLQLCISFLTVVIITLGHGDFTFHLPNESLIPLLFLGIANTGIGCYLYFSKLDKLPVQSVSVLGYLEPLSAVILSTVFLHETMTPLQIIGAILVLGGALYAELCRAG